MNKGIVYFVGAGPGHAKLITVRGLELLKKADAIVYDRLASPSLLLKTKPGALKIYVGKRPDRHSMKQEEINDLLVELASEGHTVVRLKGGDPSVFGRVGEEAEQLVNHGIPFEIVPGISSATAVPIYAGIPITHREYNSSFSVVTGHEKPEKLDSKIRWDKLAAASETLIFLMGVAKIRYISEQLMKYGKKKDTPVALVRWGTTRHQQTLVGTLETIASLVERENFQPPAVIIVGEVVSLRDKLAWAELLPLFGMRILVATAQTNNSQLAALIEEQGGETILFPTVETVDAVEPSESDLLCNVQWSHYDALLFDHHLGVQQFFRWLKKEQIDIRTLAAKHIIAVGHSAAKALQQYAIIADQVVQDEMLLHDENTLRQHLDLLPSGSRPLKRIFYPCSTDRNDMLVSKLEHLGVEVHPLSLYHEKWPDDHIAHLIHMCHRKEIDLFAFTSAKAVETVSKALKSCGVEANDLYRLNVACIGEKTAHAARKHGYQVSIVAKQPTIQSLVEAIVQHRRETKNDPAFISDGSSSEAQKQ